jgi:hypothetical protein
MSEDKKHHGNTRRFDHLPSRHWRFLGSILLYFQSLSCLPSAQVEHKSPNQYYLFQIKCSRKGSRQADCSSDESGKRVRKVDKEPSPTDRARELLLWIRQCATYKSHVRQVSSVSAKRKTKYHK